MKIQNLLLVIFISILESNGFIWPCIDNTDCETLSINATCSNGGNCLCPPGQVYSTTSLTCLDALLFGEKCKESVQCALMPTGARCINGVCQCKKDYTYIQGRCKKLNILGEKCNEHLDCWFGYNRQSVMCLKGFCTCAPGYYERHSEICRQKSSELEPCTVHTDCETQNCVNFVCITNTKVDQIPFTTLTSEDIKLIPLTRTISKNTLANDKNPSKVVSKKFGDNCTKIAQQCEGLDYSICVENVCYCKQGYYPHPTTKKCFAELGMPSTSTTCENQIFASECSCKRNFFSDENLRTCRKPIVFTAPCTADNQCSPYAAYCKLEKPRKCICPVYSEYDSVKQLCIQKQGLGAPCEENKNCPTDNSVCSKDKICICKDKYNPVNGTCLPGIGAHCTENNECKIENAICSKENIGGSNTCICNPDFIHISDSCLKKALHIGDDCIYNKQCEIMLAKCVQNNCICAENEHYSHGKCELRKYIGQSCFREGECFMPSNQKSVECRNSVCSCKDSYQTDFDGTTCIESNNASRQLHGIADIFSFTVIISAITIFKIINNTNF